MAIRAIQVALLSLLGLTKVAADICPDDPEVDLCEESDFSYGHSMSPSFNLLVGVLGLSGHGKPAVVAMLALSMHGAMADTTCGELKSFYKRITFQGGSDLAWLSRSTQLPLQLSEACLQCG